MGRWVDVHCDNEEELGRVLKFVWGRMDGGMDHWWVRQFEVTAILGNHDDQALEGPSDQIVGYIVRCRRSWFEDKAISMAIQRVKRGPVTAGQKVAAGEIV